MGSGVASACLLSTLQSPEAPGAASIQLLRRRFVTTEATAITHPEPHSWAEESPGTTQHQRGRSSTKPPGGAVCTKMTPLAA